MLASLAAMPGYWCPVSDGATVELTADPDQEISAARLVAA